jgi:hypothetical protein
MSTILSPCDGETFESARNKLWMTQEWQWPNHLQKNSKYNFDRILEKGVITDCSFLLQLEEKPIVAFLGFIAEDVEILDVPGIVIEDREQFAPNAGRAFLKEFDEILNKSNGPIWYRDFLTGGKPSILSMHLLEKGAKASPMFSQIIDLSSDVAYLRTSIRKSYKSLINWGERELHPVIYDASNITWDIMNSFRMLHIQEAGRETRSEESWRRQMEVIQAGEAFVVMGCLEGELVTAGLYMYSKMNCYYCMSASRRDMFDKPLFHSIMWTAILHAKKIGCRWLEMGEQVYSNHPLHMLPSKKQMGISKFKAGFGGDLQMFLDLKLDRDLG